MTQFLQRQNKRQPCFCIQSRRDEMFIEGKYPWNVFAPEERDIRCWAVHYAPTEQRKPSQEH